MNVVAIIFGILAIILIVLTAIIPIVGAVFAWIGGGIAVIGVVFGLLSDRTNGRNVSIFALVLAVLRLAIGGGIF